MDKDWDALDLSKPFTAIGILSEAIFMEHDTEESCGVLNRVIETLLDNPKAFRWT